LDRKAHWDNVYNTRPLEQVSWYQPKPETSLGLISGLLKPSVELSIIDMGGGDSFLAENLLHLGYGSVAVLDISEAALARAKQRMGSLAKQVEWIVSDAADFLPVRQYDCWHDRAAFHFLTDEERIASYVRAASKGVKPGGFLVVGTFSEQGPNKCSGLGVKQYTAAELSDCFAPYFEKIACQTIDHRTPSGNVQNFVFCSFKKMANA
jgi:SAM-dependent methyltransferase